METVKILEDINNLKNNKIMGDLTLNNSVIYFHGENNILFCQKGVKLKDSIINFNGNNSLIYLSVSPVDYSIRVQIFNNSVIFFGKNNNISPLLRISIQESRNFMMGDNCIIGANLFCRTSDCFLVYDLNTKHRLNNPNNIYIGDDVFIGDGCNIVNGCTIKSNAVISHFTTLSNNFVAESNCYYEGNPAKIIHDNVIFENKYTGYFKEEDIERNEIYTGDYSKKHLPSYDKNLFEDVKKLSSLEKLDYIHHIIIPSKQKNSSHIHDLDFSKYKLALRGLDHFYFLINDTNQELKQHFDDKYNNNFDVNLFTQHLNFKAELFSKHNVAYYYFVVPDKSVVCKELLPFNTDYLRRNIDAISNFKDFANVLQPKHYFNLDSHINYEGGFRLTFNFLNFMDPSFTVDTLKKLLLDSNIKKIIHNFDFLTERNWSYSEDEKLMYPNHQENQIFIPKKLIDAFNQIPDKFNYDGVRKSEFFINEDSFSDLRVLIFRDSSTNLLKWFFPFYFRESFFYWDHGNLNEDVIRWFNPDVIIELRTERLLDNIPVPSWVENKKDIFLNDSNK